MAGVPVQLEVLVLVRVPVERVEDWRAKSKVFVEGFQFLRLNHQLLAFGVALWQESIVAVVEEGRVLVVCILYVDCQQGFVLSRWYTLESVA